MFRHILVPLDGSRLAAVAAPYAVTLARAFDARVSLLGVVEPLPEFARLPSASAQEADERNITASTAYLESVATTMRARDLAVTTVVRHGDPAAEITAYAEQGESSLIVMGTHGRTGLERVRMGSVAQHVLRHATVPTLVVPRHTDGAVDGAAAVAEVTVTLDGSTLSEEALPIATSIAGALAVPLTLLRVIPTWSYLATTGWDGGYYYPETDEMMRDEEQAVGEYLAAVAARLGGRGHEARTHWQRSATNRGGEEIAAYLAARPAGIAVIASHGRGGMLRWALGSTAEEVLDQAPCPILIARAGTLATSETVGQPAVTAP